MERARPAACPSLPAQGRWDGRAVVLMRLVPLRACVQVHAGQWRLFRSSERGAPSAAWYRQRNNGVKRHRLLAAASHASHERRDVTECHLCVASVSRHSRTRMATDRDSSTARATPRASVPRLPSAAPPGSMDCMIDASLRCGTPAESHTLGPAPFKTAPVGGRAKCVRPPCPTRAPAWSCSPASRAYG